MSEETFDYIVTFRLDSDTASYEKQRNKLIELSDVKDKTTSTLVFSNRPSIKEFWQMLKTEAKLTKEARLTIFQLRNGKLVKLWCMYQFEVDKEASDKVRSLLIPR